jgi:TolB-like protein
VSTIQRDNLSDADKKAIRMQLDRLLQSRQFQKSAQRRRFLEYIVQETLAGRTDRLTGHNLALEVFRRSDAFDPAIDPVVRVEAGRLRDRLREYYAAEGASDPIHIELPRGTYAPRIELRDENRLARQAEASAPGIASTIPSVAVLPFDDLSAERNLGHLGDGLSEDIITALSRFPDLRVVARGSSFAYRGKPVDARQIGKELGVGYVVEGSVRQSGGKLRVVAQLIATATGEHVWAERFDKWGAEPWALQDEIIAIIVSAMTGEKGALKQAQYPQAWGKGATTLEEYDFYLRGHDQLMRYTKEGIARSGDIWREGLAKFPGSPLLEVKLGWHHMVRAYAFAGDDAAADIAKAGALARRVLAHEHVSPQVARLAAWLMSYVSLYERDFEVALTQADEALALAPYDSFMRSRLTMVLVQAGRPELALQWADVAAARDPALRWSYSYGRGWALLVLERFEEAAEALAQTKFNDALLLSAIACVRLGRIEEARAKVAKAMAVDPAFTLARWRRGYSFQDPAILDRCAADLAQAGLA